MADPTLWQAVLGELEVTASKAHFKTFLEKTKLREITDSTATVYVPDIFVRSFIESKYRDVILALLQRQTPTITELRFIIDSDTPLSATEQHRPLQPGDNPVETVEKPTEKREESATATIRPSQTFAAFVEGNSNRLAYAVSLAVATNPGTLYNPLFIYGGVGLGKTHLMHAIANQVMLQNAKMRVLYVSCEKFTNDYITAITTKSTGKLKQTYRTVDLLLIDDIQFLANKEGTQEEFFNTFNTLHQSNRQIVIAADRPPKAILGLEERLSSRFGWGMVVDVQPPNFETRFAILKSKCTEKGIAFSDDALTYIAKQIQSNIRELEGALNRVIIYCQMTHVPFSYESARAALEGLIVPASRKTYSAETVITLASEHFGLSVNDLTGKKRNKELVYPRHITMYLLREELDLSFPVIGREMGGKDHTTVMHGHNKIVADIQNPRVQSDLTRIKERLISL